MPTIELHHVDAFTNTPFEGNPAGVVVNANELTEANMQLIARELNLSETAFVLDPTAAEIIPHDITEIDEHQPNMPQADIRIRFFTPTSEVDFCGHATVATLFTLAKLGMHGLGNDGKNSVQVETKAGQLEMSVTNTEEETEMTFTAPPVDMRAYSQQGEHFAGKAGMPLDAIDTKASVLIDRKLNYLYVPVVSLEKLQAISFDFARIRNTFSEEETVVFCFYTNQGIESGADLHARGLAPLVGIDEDPFTGSMQAGLIHAAKQNVYIPTDQKEIHTEQGHSIGRPSSARITHDTIANTVLVTANAATVFAATMEIK
ncbi:MAG: PhzF family phenazine biosynthesis protein [Candidatus Saccharimonadales bacterium]